MLPRIAFLVLTVSAITTHAETQSKDCFDHHFSALRDTFLSEVDNLHGGTIPTFGGHISACYQFGKIASLIKPLAESSGENVNRAFAEDTLRELLKLSQPEGCVQSKQNLNTGSSARSSTLNKGLSQRVERMKSLALKLAREPSQPGDTSLESQRCAIKLISDSTTQLNHELNQVKLEIEIPRNYDGNLSFQQRPEMCRRLGSINQTLAFMKPQTELLRATRDSDSSGPVTVADVLIREANEVSSDFQRKFCRGMGIDSDKVSDDISVIARRLSRATQNLKYEGEDIERDLRDINSKSVKREVAAVIRHVKPTGDFESHE